MYSSTFYIGINERSETSARGVLSLLSQFVRFRSCVDVGCGEGVWTNAAKEAGASTILGLDGPWIDRGRLQIHADQFREIDLRKPFAIGETFDIALSLEVAEHLPSACANQFVEELCALAPVVVFSAAVPMQGGTQHLNEQWPDYWNERFVRHDFTCVDVLRPTLWKDDSIAYYYRQNALLFVRHDYLSGIVEAIRDKGLRYLLGEPLALVHPAKFLGTASLKDFNPSVFMKSVPIMSVKFIRSKIAALVSQ